MCRAVHPAPCAAKQSAFYRPFCPLPLQKFSLGDGKVLIDPLSLRDYPAIAEAAGPVNIIVQMA